MIGVFLCSLDGWAFEAGPRTMSLTREREDHPIVSIAWRSLFFFWFLWSLTRYASFCWLCDIISTLLWLSIWLAFLAIDDIFARLTRRMEFGLLWLGHASLIYSPPSSSLRIRQD